MKNPNNIKATPNAEESIITRFANDVYASNGSVRLTSYDALVTEYAILIGWEADHVSKYADRLNKTGLVPPYNEED